jgi:hypothetical protein
MSFVTILQTGIKVHDLLKKERARPGSRACDWNEDLCGACAIGSLLLQKKLREQNVETVFNKGEIYFRGRFIGHHCWLTKDDQIIDVTATQLGAPLKIYVGRSDPKVYRPLSTDERAVAEIEEIWPEEQNPINYRHLLR